LKKVQNITAIVGAVALLAGAGFATAVAWNSKIAVATARSVPIYTPTPVVEPKLALWLGDSYSAGAGAASILQRFTSVASRDLGWIERNNAYGGTGYLAGTSGSSEVSHSLLACGLDNCPNYLHSLDGLGWSRSPDYIVVSGGRNDPLGSATLQAADSLLRKLKADFPKSRILVTSPIGDFMPPTENVLALRDHLKNVVKKYGAKYLDLKNPLLGHREWIVSDLVHPNNAGHQAIAKAFESAFEELHW